MPGRILDRLLPLVPIVVPPAAEQPHEKNIVSSLDFPQYRNFSLEGRAFRLEIRDKRERCTGFVSWIVKKSCRPATDIIYLKFYLTILPTDDRLNFHESWNAEISFIYRNIHIRFPRIELNFISTNPREGRRVDNERGEKGNNERHARRKIPSHGDIPLSTRAYARFTDWPDSMNRNAPSLQSTVQPSDQPSNRPTNQPASQPANQPIRLATIQRYITFDRCSRFSPLWRGKNNSAEPERETLASDGGRYRRSLLSDRAFPFQLSPVYLSSALADHKITTVSLGTLNTHNARP